MSSIIHDMVSAHEKIREGIMYCNGYQDAERIGINECHCELQYKLQIDYKQ